MPDWIDNFEHGSVTDENREAFNKSMGEYTTINDAVYAGFNAKRKIGVPFKLPESMDNVPEADRGDFTTRAHKLLGIEHVTDIANLSEVDLKKGMADGVPYDENFATAFKQFAIDNKIPKNLLTPIAEFFNLASAQSRQDLAARKETELATAKRGVNDALVAHPDFGTQEAVDEKTILLHRALKDHVGVSIEEANEVSEFMKNREGATNPVLRRILINALAPLAAEGSTDGGGGVSGGDGIKQPSPYEAKKARWPKSPDQWGEQSDKWDDEGLQTKKVLGYKEAS